MDSTTQFFAKLRKLAVTLESETAKLQHEYENRGNDGDSETTMRAMRAYHELNSEVLTLKEQIQDNLVRQKAQMDEVSSFIKACKEMKRWVTEDIQTLKAHWEKYGYEVPRETQGPTKAKGQESEAGNEVADDNEIKSAEEEKGSQEEADHVLVPRGAGPPPFTDVLRTPQLSDFGLSPSYVKRALAGVDWCSEVPPMPEMSLPHPSLNSPELPPMPITPKRALQMNDDDLKTPQMQDFGISEHTMCLNNDFTMDLLQKNIPKPQRPPQDEAVPAVNSLSESLQSKDNMESPEPPVLCTPGFKIRKTKGQCSSPARGSSDPGSPSCPVSTTPEIPVFQTPYLNRLVSDKKSARQHEPDDYSRISELPTLPSNGVNGSKCTWDDNVPEISLVDEGEQEMPQMPKLESVLGRSLQSRSVKISKKTSEHENITKEPDVNHLELDGPTQEFTLGTPRVRMEYQDPSTPELPDLSSLTQDICKLVSQVQLKKTMVVGPCVRPDKDKNRAVSLSVVSATEFQSLPGYLRQMTLHSLNQAVHSINTSTANCEEQKTEFRMEELKKITSLGAKTPVYILCLTELQRLKHVGGTGNTSLYKLVTHN
uniref:SKA complex subunit 3 isoform X2 n=1 Tax=Monopterus albus TaxID=43700 RepID=UPI0009B4E9EA|nr:spindle and kinetochore-associated protein 3 isoform X2 [Monopterus albus]